MKKLLSILMSVAMIVTTLVAFGITASAATITSPSTTGNGVIAMNGTAIPSPVYTVTIPTTITFGEC
ncbi:MAG: hypothetical protein RR263_05935, partial [Oscillospiraceae bacterium]